MTDFMELARAAESDPAVIGIYADWLEENGQSEAALFLRGVAGESGFSDVGTSYGDDMGYGYGCGDGYGYGSGFRFGDGYRYGDGGGAGYGYGTGYGLDEGDGYGDGYGDGEGFGDDHSTETLHE